MKSVHKIKENTGGKDVVENVWRRRQFMLSSICFIFFLSTIGFINEIRLDYLLGVGKCAISGGVVNYDQIRPTLLPASPVNTTSDQESKDDEDEMRILIGILTLPDKTRHRDFLRRVYGVQMPQLPNKTKVDIKFVFCNLTSEEQKSLISLEILHHNDIIILNCTENMNKGKTYSYFSTLPTIFNNNNKSQPPYHYVMKADDDTFIRLPNLVDSLTSLPRTDLYYGYVIPCDSMDPHRKYMSGMGYLVSWDLVEWLSVTDIPKQHFQGPEDKVFGDWMKTGRRGNNRFNAKWSMYNYPDPPNKCSHELWPDTIAVHLLKTPEKWFRTLNYFNVTNNAALQTTSSVHHHHHRRL